MAKNYKDYRGLRGLVAAEILTDNGTTFAADFWHELEGALSCSLEGEESTATLYRDNLAAKSISTEGPDTATVNMDVLSNKVRAWLEGRTYVETNDIYIKTPKKVKNFVFGFIGGLDDGTEEAVIVYCTTVTGGNTERNTIDDGTDVTTVEYVFTGVYTKTKFDLGEAGMQPVKSLTVPLAGETTEELLFGTFDENGISDVKPLTPSEVIALGA